MSLFCILDVIERLCGDDLIGNPFLPALHGGATAGFLEAAAIVELVEGPAWRDGPA